MPTKGQTNLREEDFRFNQERTQVQCRACNDNLPPERREWIQIKSGQNHLSTGAHTKAVQRGREQQRRKERLGRERDAASATDKLREIAFAVPRTSMSVAGEQSSSQICEAEENMWEEYRLNGASFTAGDMVEKAEMREDRLRKEAEIFGLWNPESTARKLGFGDQSIVEEEDDAWLAQIIGNIGRGRKDAREGTQEMKTPGEGIYEGHD
ncbi:hypothetical protein R3P38DRAFT_2781572 [Favolaschia claudopus]|uniref:Uncharacterized protein n=1 Tax=Favolaschia claudopus TaxID=2862362 RepID=A0AAW0B4I1_9AGAR